MKASISFDFKEMKEHIKFGKKILTQIFVPLF